MEKNETSGFLFLFDSSITDVVKLFREGNLTVFANQFHKPFFKPFSKDFMLSWNKFIHTLLPV